VLSVLQGCRRRDGHISIYLVGAHRLLSTTAGWDPRLGTVASRTVETPPWWSTERRGRVEPQLHAGLALAHIPALVLRTEHAAHRPSILHSRPLVLVVAALGAVQVLRLLQLGEGQIGAPPTARQHSRKGPRWWGWQSRRRRREWRPHATLSVPASSVSGNEPLAAARHGSFASRCLPCHVREREETRLCDGINLFFAPN
jgi:hypothetical protein